MLSHWYVYLFFLLFLDNAGIPVPGEGVMIMAGVLAGSGNLNLWIVIGLSILASMIGSNLGYLAGYAGGKNIVKKYGKYALMTAKRTKRLERIFHRYGDEIVVAARFIIGLRQAVGILSGIGKMKWIKFFCFNSAGAVLWVSFWVALSYFLGVRMSSFIKAEHHLESILLIILAVVFSVTFTVIYVRDRRSEYKKPYGVTGH